MKEYNLVEVLVSCVSNDGMYENILTDNRKCGGGWPLTAIREP